jgi:ligand-binding SRPBCC domain-containing protein
VSLSVCPIATINAAPEPVWEFLCEPKHYDVWWDAQTQSILPDGHVHAGQVIRARTNGLGKAWAVTVTVNAADDSKRQIDLTTKLPLGITVHNHITCTALKGGNSQVSSG